MAMRKDNRMTSGQEHIVAADFSATCFPLLIPVKKVTKFSTSIHCVPPERAGQVLAGWIHSCSTMVGAISCDDARVTVTPARRLPDRPRAAS
jgi:hypothetical protein